MTRATPRIPRIPRTTRATSTASTPTATRCRSTAQTWRTAATVRTRALRTARPTRPTPLPTAPTRPTTAQATRAASSGRLCAGLWERRQAWPARLECRGGRALRRFLLLLRLLVRAEDRSLGLAGEQALELLGLDRLAAQ